MAIAKRFEDLSVWQEARELVGQIYALTSVSQFNRDIALRDQIRRAAISVMSNIAEGFGRRTNRDFAKFLTQARGSVAETQSHLYVALDQGYIDEQSFQQLYEKCDHISRMLQRLITYLHSTSTRNAQRTTRNTKGVISVD